MRHERLQPLLRHRGIESLGGFIQDEELGAAAEREQQRELGTRAARQRLHELPAWQLERAAVALVEIATPAREESGGETNHLFDRHVAVEILVFADEAGAAPDRETRPLVV